MSYTLFNSTTAATDLIAQPGRAVNTFPSGLVRVDQTYLGLTANASIHRAILAVGNDMPDGDTSPCIDGLKIFPEVQERRREDGWTEYLVSAFGRTDSPSRYTLRSKTVLQCGYKVSIYDDADLTQFGGSFVTDATFISSPVIEIVADVITHKFVVPKGAQVDLTLSPEHLKLYKTTGTPIPNELDIFEIQELFGGFFNATYTAKDYDGSGTDFRLGRQYIINTNDFITNSASGFGKDRVSLFFKLTNSQQTDFGAFEEYVLTFSPTGQDFLETEISVWDGTLLTYEIDNPVTLGTQIFIKI